MHNLGGVRAALSIKLGRDAKRVVQGGSEVAREEGPPDGKGGRLAPGKENKTVIFRPRSNDKIMDNFGSCNFVGTYDTFD